MNVIEHVAVLAEPEQLIQPDDIPLYEDTPDWTPPDVADAAAPALAANLDDAFHVAKDRIIGHFEREYLSRLVTRASGNMSKAARLAGIDRTTLYRLMDKHGLSKADTADGA